VLLDMESPGGEAVGAFEAAAAVRRLAGIQAGLGDGQWPGSASAAYAIASAATRIVSIPTGISGSIGVVLAHFDYSEMLTKEGIKPTFIHAGANKVDANPYQALPEKVRDRLQAEVNTFYDLFVETVAAGRPGLTDKAIRGTEAGTFMGAEALELGLIDQLGTFESVLAELSSTQGPGMGQSRQSGATMSAAHTATSMAALAAAGALAAGVAPAAPAAAAAAPVPAAALPAAVLPAAAVSEPAALPAAAAHVDHTAALAAERKAGAVEERARIGAILGHEAAAGRGKLAAHLAFKTSMAVDDAGEMLAASATEAAPAAGLSDAAAFEASVSGRAELVLDPAEPAAAAGETVDWAAVADRMNAKAGLTAPKR
jgi:signal peptide peptidase SppA